jgi:DNA-binding transcriptional MocR family regulator
MISVDHASSTPLVAQIHASLVAMIDSGRLRPGTKLPSIRAMARICKVSLLTVTNAYNRLVAEGLLEARRASGFFVPTRAGRKAPARGPALTDASVDSGWLLHRVFQENSTLLPIGCGWLPGEALFADGIKHALGSVARKAGAAFSSYGNPHGYLPLRKQIVALLGGHGIDADEHQVILTHGASQGLDLVARSLLTAGDTVLVDDPGYGNIFPALQDLGLQLVGVPRTQEGPDVDALEALIPKHRPKAFITTTTLQNPTGTTSTPAVSYRILRLAEQHDFYVIEDEIFADLQVKPTQTMASLDQLRRVIYVSSFSKTISPSLRVGFLACPVELAERIVRLKMASSLTTSETLEQVVHAILVEGHHRGHLTRLRERLAAAQDNVCDRLEATGLRLFHRPPGGMFVWAGFERPLDPKVLAQKATREGIILAPGYLFRPDHAPTPWFRFNVAYAHHDSLYRFLDRVGRELK